MPHSLQNSSSAFERRKIFQPTAGNGGFIKIVNIKVKNVQVRDKIWYGVKRVIC